MAAPEHYDLSRPQRIHVVGIGGAGMSAIATVLHAQGHTVSGSDAADSATVGRLRDLGIEVRVGHDPANVSAAELVTASTAVPSDNPELAAARAVGVPVLRRAEAMAALCAMRKTLAVSGTHGKTTTSALLAYVLSHAGCDPSFIVGSDVPGLGAAAWGTGEWFVVEADESDGTFVELGAHSVVLTSVEPDHLEHHGSFTVLREAFAHFLGSAPGLRFVCIDDPVTAELARSIECATYGTAPGAEHRLEDVRPGAAEVSFVLDDERFVVGLPGLHNARNAAAAALVAHALGVGLDEVRRALAAFPGVRRRAEPRGEVAGVTLVDDYAHLPGEVRDMLAAARAGGWRRVVCIFQPHRHTRVAALAPDFAHAFLDADVLAVTDIYLPAGQVAMPGVSGKLVVDAVLDAHPFARVAWLPTRRQLLTWLRAELRPGDLCLTLGAGDLTTLPDELLSALAGP